MKSLVVVMKNGHKIKVGAKDPLNFYKDLMKGVEKDPNARDLFWVDSNLMVNVAEIACIHPDDWSE